MIDPYGYGLVLGCGIGLIIGGGFERSWRNVIAGTLIVALASAVRHLS